MNDQHHRADQLWKTPEAQGWVAGVITTLLRDTFSALDTATDEGGIQLPPEPRPGLYDELWFDFVWFGVLRLDPEHNIIRRGPRYEAFNWKRRDLDGILGALLKERP